MKLLRELLYECNLVRIIGDTSISISNIHFDSREASHASLFVAIKGINIDGHDFIPDAIKSGSVAVICEQVPSTQDSQITYVQVFKSSVAMGVVSSNFFNNPSSKLKLIGITGTNGKTSTAHYLFSLFKKLNFKTGLISTIEHKIDNESLASTHTTPNSFEINRLLALMVKSKCDFCFMEVSSHGIAQNRISGLDFDIAVFSNISRDHLDYHKSFKNYINIKKQFFDNLKKEAISIANVDDMHSATMLLDTKSKKILYGIKSHAHYRASILESNLFGLHLEIEKQTIGTKLIGDFNAYNLLAVYSVAHQLGINSNKILNILSNINPVAGRFNVIRSSSDVVGVVDYAHTPDALKKVITSISNFCEPIKDLIIVLGCGGNRDQGKRPIMGKIAFDNSSKIIFTSDNPRFENPKDIVDEMCLNLPNKKSQKVYKIYDRKEAIQFAFHNAAKQSVILVAGKGHEKFQEINGRKIPFDDTQIITNILKR